ncbi:glycosyltransferase [Sphingobacterium sp. MYb388]|uniref:glycosyltransferase n=1 Tax=Sphingobacterium sp. MYb388 TaxID=2745437 RepID=UPI0030A13276
MVNLSIIVPVYNVEDFVERALLSIVAKQQGLNDYELICVDDGSTDRSAALIRKLAEQYPMIKLIQQQNQGVSVARNTGIDHARGIYMMFMDPDDFYVPDSIVSLLNCMEEHDLDLLAFDIQRTTADHLERVDKIHCQVYSQKSFYQKTIALPFCVAYIYRKALIGFIRFPKGLIAAEDFVFVESVSLHAKQIGVVEQRLYGYFSNQHSVMNKKDDQARNQRFAQDYLTAIQLFKELVDDNRNTELAPYLRFRLEFRLFHFLKRMKDRNVPFPEVNAYLKMLKIGPFEAIGKVQLQTKSWFFRTMILNHPLLFALAYRIPSRILI